MAESSEKTGKRRRGQGRPFQKGVSGNPGGRPPLTEVQRQARELKAQAQPDAVRFLHSVVVDDEAEMRDRITASKALLEGLDAVKLEHSVNTSDDSGLVEMVKRLAGVDVGKKE